MTYKNKPLHSYYHKLIKDVDDADWLIEEMLKEQLDDDKDVVVKMLVPKDRD